MKKLKVAFCALLVVVTTLTCFAPALAKVGEVYMCSANGLRVHAKPTGASAVVGKLKKGDKVIHKATKNGGWWKISTLNGKNEGYAFRSFFTPVGSVLKKNAYYRVYKISKVIVRNGPRATATKIAVIKRGTEVQLLGKQGTWGYIKGSNGSKGFVQLKYLKYVRG